MKRMSEIKLLPCPFCGGEARLESTGQYAVVGCKNDNCQGYACCYKYDSKKTPEAIREFFLAFVKLCGQRNKLHDRTHQQKRREHNDEQGARNGEEQSCFSLF